jgi:hypothetical protein
MVAAPVNEMVWDLIALLKIVAGLLMNIGAKDALSI